MKEKTEHIINESFYLIGTFIIAFVMGWGWGLR